MTIYINVVTSNCQDYEVFNAAHRLNLNILPVNVGEGTDLTNLSLTFTSFTFFPYFLDARDGELMHFSKFHNQSKLKPQARRIGTFRKFEMVPPFIFLFADSYIER